MKHIVALLILTFTTTAIAEDLAQLYEKAYFLETAKGQTEEALEIYRKIAATKPDDENRETILLALGKLQKHYQFPTTVPFQIGFTKFGNGDRIEILEVRSLEKDFKAGGKYLVLGRYTLNSQDAATLAFYLTTQVWTNLPTTAAQTTTIKKGTGEFELVSTLWTIGWPHLSFYPQPGGNSFGTVYFGTGDWLKTEPFKAEGSLQEKVDGFDMANADLKNVARTFGEPNRYFFKDKTYEISNLPEIYLMDYPDGFRIFVDKGKIVEFRFEEEPIYKIGGITIGSSLNQVLKILGEPKKTVAGEECTYAEKILYKNSKGLPDGHAYYGAKGLRLFFMNDKVAALYVTDNTILRGK